MNDVLTYGIEVTLVSIIFFIGYLIVKRISNPGFRRAYLLGSISLMVLLPLLQIQVETPLPSVELPGLSGDISYAPPTSFTKTVSISKTSDNVDVVRDVSSSDLILDKKASIDFISWSIILYVIVALFFLIRLAIGLWSIYRLKKEAECIIFSGQKIYVVKNSGFTGASFFHLILIGEKVFCSESFQMVLQHEQIHVKRLHSLDILLADLFRIVFWLNPVAWMYCAEIRHNTELETDERMVMSTNKLDYSKLLLSLSTSAFSPRVMNSFSAVKVKSRLLNIATPVKNHLRQSLIVSFLTVLSAVVVISCNDKSGDEGIQNIPGAMEEVKQITTRFISHHPDTKEKDSKVVAVATFLPDGSLDKLEQHMTYPYNFEKVEPRYFWSKPTRENIYFVMDGLDIEPAENNLLYGNDWPVDFAKAVVADGHPLFKNNEFYEFESSVSDGESNLPKEITTGYKPKFNIDMSESFLVETFTYQNNKVSLYSVSEKAEPTNSDNASAQKAQQTTDNVSYNYDGENLIEVSSGTKTLKFAYEGNFMKRSERWIAGKQYNTRLYSYKENKLLDKIEILNVNSELEYTILYEYSFYD
ncbi:MAG: M56 family metallopeptidase [Bacteroidota bacterium]